MLSLSLKIVRPSESAENVGNNLQTGYGTNTALREVQEFRTVAEQIAGSSQSSL